MDKCPTPGCEFDAGHAAEHPCGRRILPGEPCRYCGGAEPCSDCWIPATPAMLKGLAAEAGKDVTRR